MVKDILKFSFFVPTYIYGGGCKNISGKIQGEENNDPVKELKEDIEGLNIDDNDIISYSDFLSSGSKFDSQKPKVKFDNNAVVNVTKFADKFKEKIEDLGPQNVCDLKIEEKLKIFIERIIKCLKGKLKEGYNLDDNNLKNLYIVAEFKSESNKIIDEASKYIGNFEKNMSNVFKKCSNVYILSDYKSLNFDEKYYSSKVQNAQPDKKAENEYIYDRDFIFRDKNKTGLIDTQSEKAGVNDYYAVINLKDYKDYYICLKK